MHTDSLYINGKWVSSSGSGRIDVVNAATEEVIDSIPQGTAEDVDKAVRAAHDAFEAWSTTSTADRAKYLRAIAEGIQSRAGELAEVISKEVGAPTWFSQLAQVGLPGIDVASVADIIEHYEFEETVGSSLVVKEPVGVVGCITPWNYPLHQITAKIAPALAVGCTVVVKPSEIAPLNAYILAEIIDSAGLPAGVFNLVTGYGPEVGEALASHPLVDMISFTGSTRAGRRVSALASETVKRVALELGGKSPNVILEDADLEKAVPDAIAQCFINSGQTCSALTRLIVPRSKLDEVERLAKQTAEEYTIGDPFGEGTRLGPVISETQRDRVVGYIEKGVQEGARLVTGGPERPEGFEKGYFVKPTVFSDVRPDMTIAQEEIFGPVLAILPYDDEEEAVRIANDTQYGLAGGVWAGDPDKAKAVARRIRTGQVAVNGGSFNPIAPFGGYKQSGNGRELGKFGIEEFLEVKALQL
jgi:acyl-CoA reductase-like NAD-dependent aldehyde dehydrogenase